MNLKNYLPTFSVYRRSRAARVHGEFLWPYFVKVGIASPTVHRWWAVTVYMMFPRAWRK